MPDLVGGQEARIGGLDVGGKKSKEANGTFLNRFGGKKTLQSVHQASSTEKMGVPNSILDAVVKNWSKEMVSLEALRIRHIFTQSFCRPASEKKDRTLDSWKQVKV